MIKNAWFHAYLDRRDLSAFAIPTPSLSMLDWITTDMPCEKETAVDDLKKVSTFNEAQALQLLTVLSDMTGQELSCSHLSHVLGIAYTHVLRYLALAEDSRQWWRVRCFNEGENESGVKSKGYMTSTALACKLLGFGVGDAHMLKDHHALGALFETVVINALRRQLPDDVALFYWRMTHGEAEVDIILRRGNTLYPIEVKSSSRVTGAHAKGSYMFRTLYSATFDVAPALIIYTGSELYALNDEVYAVPWPFICTVF